MGGLVAIFSVLFASLLQATPAINVNEFSYDAQLNKPLRLTKGRDCARLLCPPVDDPVCVRVQPLHGVSVKTGDAVFIQMINKCEMQHLKCYKGIKAVVVNDNKCDPSLASRDRRRVIESKRDGEQVENKHAVSSIRRKRSFNDVDVDTVPDEYDLEEPCPASCPSVRRVMVCGRCDHNIYKTFLSRCHMRQFNCENKREQMSIVSMQPCVFAAPFQVTDQIPQNVISDYDTTDKIMEFINHAKQLQYNDVQTLAQEPRPQPNKLILQETSDETDNIEDNFKGPLDDGAESELQETAKDDYESRDSRDTSKDVRRPRKLKLSGGSAWAPDEYAYA